jgi:hypothetical protein
MGNVRWDFWEDGCAMKMEDWSFEYGIQKIDLL